MTLPLDHLKTEASWLGRIDPRWKLAGLVLAAMAVSLLRTLPPALIAAVSAVGLVYLGRVPWTWYLVRIATLAILLMFFVVWLPFLDSTGPFWEIGPVVVSGRGMEIALVVVLKASTVVTLMLVVWATAPVDANLKAAHALHIPGIVVQLIVLTYRYVFLLAEELGRLRIAVRVRGFRSGVNLHTYKTVGHVAGTLLVRSYERAERISHAMRCRGFDGRYRSLMSFRTRLADVAFFLGIALGAAGMLLWDFMRR